ncbi:MAG TPA: hydantoinase/carbamoylase family amidase [Burkholderiaceae bacterium]|jgi:N-carbamoyl-L-amino-acid hydrolase
MSLTPVPPPGRLWTRLLALAAIGATARGGVNRQALSDEDIAACRQLIAWGDEAGLHPSLDAAGNLFLTLKSARPAAAPLVMGSHLDTQPTGGKFDGALGVLAALEAAAALARQPSAPDRDVVVAAWMNEEGGRFAPGMMGSEVFTGERTLAWIREVVDGAGTRVGDALDRMRDALGEVERVPAGFAVGHYLELHIEQGPVLEAQGIDIGVVTGIQGKKTFEVELRGTEGHAGTLQMSARQDALVAFNRIAVALDAAVGAHDEAVKFTIGRVRVEPNAPSVVPGRVTFSIDLRHPDNATLERLGAVVRQTCERLAAPCAATVRALVDSPSNAFDPDLRSAIAAAAEKLGRSAMPLMSAAGHDARHLAKVCPSAMIFVPCRAGISHSESEWIEADQAAAGLDVLFEVAAQLVLSHRSEGSS